MTVCRALSSWYCRKHNYVAAVWRIPLHQLATDQYQGKHERQGYPAADQLF